MLQSVNQDTFFCRLKHADKNSDLCQSVVDVDLVLFAASQSADDSKAEWEDVEHVAAMST